MTRRLLARAIWLGLITGIVEATVLLVQKFGFDRMRIHTSVHIAWMAPLADVILFSSLALLAGLVAHMARRLLAPRIMLVAATGMLGAVAVWSVTQLYPELYAWAGIMLALGAGVQVARMVAGATPALDRMVARTIVPLGGLVAVTAVALVFLPRWRESRALAALPAARGGAPNVLLLILDTVRAQSLGLHGAIRPTSRRLEALAADGVAFDYALSTAPWTLPSHASMFTGRYPHELTADWLTPLDDADPTLAGVMQRHGYVTGGFAANYMVSWEVGLTRGFAHFEDYRISLSQLALSSAVLRSLARRPRARWLVRYYDQINRKRAPQVNADVLRWIGALGERPFFAFVNYMDAHELYNPPPPFRRSFGPDTARKVGMVRWVLGGEGYRSQKAKMEPHEVQAELDAYEESIAWLDSQVGVLVDSLESRGMLDRTIVIVTSDHGEHFGEHGKWAHANSLYPELLHVPLVIRAPGLVPAGRRISGFVTLRDLAATILAMGPGSDELPGQTLSRFWDSTAVTASRAPSPITASFTNGYWTERSMPNARRAMRSAMVGALHVIEDVREPAIFEVFELTRDPAARQNLASDSARRAVINSARRLLPPSWRSQARGIIRRAGEIGAIQH